MSRLHRLAGFTVAATLALTLLGCNGVITFTFEEESGEQVIAGMSLPGTDLLPFDPFTFDVNLEQQLEKRNADGAREVRLDALELVVTDKSMPDGDTDHFDFLDSITFHVNAEGLERKKLAWHDDVPDSQKQSLSLEVDDSIDLKPYVERGMKLETTARGSAPEDDTAIKGVITIWVRAL